MRKLHILVAPDSFKGSLSSLQAAKCMENGIRKVYPDAIIQIVPIADGGEGTVDALVTAANGVYKTCHVTGPLGRPVKAVWGRLPDGTAVIESAAASGLTLVPAEARDPLSATTYGTGELMRAALDEGCRRIVLGIGGSATTDGGAGMAQALGLSLRNERGQEIGFGGGALSAAVTFDRAGLDPRLGEIEIVAACDVRNPLTGEHGAAAVYGPQKGASARQIEILDSGLRNLARLTEDACDIRFGDMPGAGAGGGLGFGLMAFCGARMRPGIDLILDTAGFDRMLEECDLVLTGEGSLDAQSAYGKAVAGVAARARRHGIPLLAVAGGLGEDLAPLYELGISAAVSLVPRPMPLEEAIGNAAPLLSDAVERAMRLFKTGMDKSRLFENDLDKTPEPLL